MGATAAPPEALDLAVEAVRAGWGALLRWTDPAAPPADIEELVGHALSLAMDLPSGGTHTGRVLGSAVLLNAETALRRGDGAEAAELVQSARERFGFNAEGVCTTMTALHEAGDFVAVLGLYGAFPRLSWGADPHPFFHVVRPAIQLAEAALALGRAPLAQTVLGDRRLAEHPRAIALRRALLAAGGPPGTDETITLGAPVMPPAQVPR